MKKLIIILSILIIGFTSYAQDVIGGRIIAKNSLFVRDRWVDTITVDTSKFLNYNRSIPTAGAVYEFVNARMGGGGGSGNVTKVGTPVNSQIGVWTGDGTIEGTSLFQWDNADTTLTLGSSTIYYTGDNAGAVGLAFGGIRYMLLNYAPGASTFNQGNTFLGYNAGAATGTTGGSSSLNNTFIGGNAGESNTTGQQNTFVGSRTGVENTTGAQNTGIGQGSFFQNISASGNAGLGFHSGLNVLGGSNTFAGTGAGEGATSSTMQYNSVLGYYALRDGTTAQYNAMVGILAGSTATTASFNSAIGGQSLLSLTTGGHNFAGGYQNSYDLTTGSYNLSVGAYVQLPSNTASGQLNIGNVIYGSGLYSTASRSSTPTTLGSIGIGLTTPTARLMLPAGTATASTAPLKLTTGTALTTPEDGAIEYHSSHLYFTIGSTRYQLDQQPGISDGDKGDITVSGSGSIWTIDNSVVSVAKIDATGTPNSGTYLRGDGSWAAPAGSGDVVKAGTPVNNQLGIWTGDGTIEGDANLTFASSTLNIGVAGASTGILTQSGVTSGTITFQPASAAGTYTITWPTTDGNSGEFLQTDGAGVLTWASASGSGTVNSGSQYRLAYYATAGAAVSEAAAITASRALVSDVNGVPTHATTTSTEIGYVNGVTSAIQTQLNNKTFTINIQSLNTSTINDAATMHIGYFPIAWSTSATNYEITIDKNCTLIGAMVELYCSTAGSGEDWSMYVRVNNTTDYLISTLGVTTTRRSWTNSAINTTGVALVAGDKLIVKSIAPTWATNPATCIKGGYLRFIEN